MKKYIVIGVILLIGGSGIYYTLQKTNALKPSNPELWLPQNADIALKVDLSEHYIEIVKELLNTPKETNKLNDSIPLFFNELKENKGAGINYLSPFYLYQSIAGRGAILKISHKETFATLATTSTNLTAINDSIYSIPNTEWKLYWNNSVLIIFQNELPTKQDSCKYNLNSDSKLLAAFINYNEIKNINLSATVSKTGMSWLISNPALNTPPKEAYKLPTSNGTQAELFLNNLNSPIIQSIYNKQTLLKSLSPPINNPIHIQYLGKGERMIKSISYEYNDDFEMSEVVKTSKVPTQNLRVLINTESKQEGLALKKELDNKISFLTPYSELHDKYILYSDKKVTPIVDSTELELFFSIKRTDDILSLSKQFKLGLDQFEIDSINTESIIKNGTITTEANIYLPEEKRGLIPILKTIHQLIDKEALKREF